MDLQTHFDQILMIYSDGRAELINNSSIAFTMYRGQYEGVGLRSLDDLLTTLREQGKIQLMEGCNYPEDVCRKITTEEFRNATGVYLIQQSQKEPIVPLGKIDIDF